MPNWQHRGFQLAIAGAMGIGLGALIPRYPILSAMLVSALILGIGALKLGSLRALALGIPLAVLGAPNEWGLNYLPLVAPFISLVVLCLSAQGVKLRQVPNYVKLLLGLAIYYSSRDLIGALNSEYVTGDGLVKYILRPFIPVVTCLVATSILRSHMARRLFEKFLVCLGIIEACFGLAQVIGFLPGRAIWILYAGAEKYFPEGAQTTQRALGTLGNPNALGVFLGMVLILWLSRWATHQWKFRLAAVGGALVIFLGMAFSRSRSALFFLVVAFLISRPKLVNVILVPLVALGLWHANVPRLSTSRLFSVFSDRSQLLTLNNRVPIWAYFVPLVFSKGWFLTGMGRSTFEAEFGYAYAVDSEYLRILGVYGLVGLILFIGVFILYLVHLRWLKSDERSYAVMLMVYLLANAFTSELFLSPKLGVTAWLMLAVMSTPRLDRIREETSLRITHNGLRIIDSQPQS